jgi:hypothetical protein
MSNILSNVRQALEKSGLGFVQKSKIITTDSNSKLSNSKYDRRSSSAQARRTNRDNRVNKNDSKNNKSNSSKNCKNCNKDKSKTNKSVGFNESCMLVMDNQCIKYANFEEYEDLHNLGDSR